MGSLLLVAALFGTLVAAGDRLPGGKLARTVAGKLVCAVSGAQQCDGGGAQDARLALAYGPELAATLAEQLPVIRFERGEFVSLPVDFRECRDRACADTSVTGEVRSSHRGEPPTVFTRVIDCAASEPPADADCGGSRAGHTYLQYWLYYPDSATKPFGRAGYHRDDWESFHVRLGPDGARASRASSHKGYNGGRPGPQNALSDAGHGGARWGPAAGHLHVAAGSHAGAVSDGGDDPFWIPPDAVRLVPLEPLIAGLGAHRFAVNPPWEKRVWRDPESPETS